VKNKRPAVFRGRHFQDEIIVLCLRWYLRYSLSYRDLEEMMAERGLSLDHSTIARWVLRYEPILSQRIRCEMRRPNRSWRVDETYVRVAGRWTYLYRAVDSEGNTIDFMLSPNRDLTAAKHFLQLALWRTREVRPRVVNVDGHPAYSRAIAELRSSGELGRRCRCRSSPYLNNIIEQDHRFIKKRIAASLGFRSVEGAVHTVAGYEAMHAIRKGQIRWLAKGDVVGQVQFIQRILGITA
jgi:transposase-like protein